MNARELEQIGPYPVVEFIAEGGMAWVFKVEDPRFRVHRALKMLKPQAAQGDEFQRFEAEAKLLARIEHPNLITIYDFGQDEQTECFYYTMTFVDGLPLSETEPLDCQSAIQIFLDILSALAKLHEQGIIHRDIKPANVLMMSDGRILLADLGIARQQDSMISLTRTGMAIGSVQYMSPEQARGETVGPTSDVFSIGLAFYQVITGHTIYDLVDEVDATSGEQVLMYLGALLHSGDELRFEFPASVPKAVRLVIEKACRFDPDDRYPDAEAMRAALIEAQSSRGAVDVQSAVAGERRRLLAFAAGLLVILAIGFGIYSVTGTEIETGPAQKAKIEPKPYYRAAVKTLEDPESTEAGRRLVVSQMADDLKPGATAVLIQASEDESVKVAVDAIKLLNTRVDDHVADQLVKLLGSEEFTVRAWAARGLGDAEKASALPALKEARDRESRGAVSRQIQRAIEQIEAAWGASNS